MEIKIYELKNYKLDSDDLYMEASGSICYQSLKDKTEYGSIISESYFQNYAEIVANNLAFKLKADQKLARALTIFLGSYFPAHGKEGKKLISEYLKVKGIEISEADLARQVIEYGYNETSSILSKNEDELFRELFDNTKVSKIVEVEIAKLVHEYIEAMKVLAEKDFDLYSENAAKFGSKIEQESVKAGKPVQIAEINEIIANSKRPTISEKDKNTYFEVLDNIVEKNNGDILLGVIKFIQTIETPSNYKRPKQMGE